MGFAFLVFFALLKGFSNISASENGTEELDKRHLLLPRLLKLYRGVHTSILLSV